MTFDGCSAPRLLWLGAADAGEDGALAGLAGAVAELRRIELVFDAGIGPFVVGDERSPQGRRLKVHSRWEAFGADFQQQLANRHFTDELLAQRPDLIVIDSLTGASMDMARIAALLGYRVLIRVPRLALPATDSRPWRWLADVFALASGLYASGQAAADEVFRCAFPDQGGRVHANLMQAMRALPQQGGIEQSFGYAHYAFGLRDHGLLYRMQLPLAGHFDGCCNVLELACGPAVFLEILRQRGIVARGVERNPASVRYARGLGFDVDEADALEYLATADARFDGIYCSHFVEHLDAEAVDRLIGLIARALRPGGVALFVFPDPESIRSQLLGFWRDPEHVRFYHPDLIELMCRGHGLETDFHSHRVDGREVVPFSYQPPLGAWDLPEASADGVMDAGVPPAGRLERLFARLGLVHPAALRRLGNAFEAHLCAQREYTTRLQSRVKALEGAVHALWAVNQTWAWDDNAVIRVRKPR